MDSVWSWFHPIWERITDVLVILLIPGAILVMFARFFPKSAERMVDKCETLKQWQWSALIFGYLLFGALVLYLLYATLPRGRGQ